MDKNKILSDNYIILQKIGNGSFGEVYLARQKNGKLVAAKVEEKSKIPRIYNEYRVYKNLIKKGFINGIPQIYDYIVTKDYNILFMQLLGQSLEDLYIEADKNFTVNRVINIAEQMINLIEQVHRCGFIHRDIKPSNFLVDIDSSDKLYIMDFGLAKRYALNGVHMKFHDKKSLIGTARYSSINMHLGIEPSRRDDLESIGYVLIYLLKGKLPWQGLTKKNGVSSIDQIGEVKLITSIDKLCSGIPSCFKEYLKYCRGLKFDEDPDYQYIKGLFYKESILIK
jgi:casein kinase 1